MARQIKPSPVVIASYDIAMFRATTMVLELIPTTNTYILGTRMRRAPKKDPAWIGLKIPYVPPGFVSP